jgi:hypothetical protein
MSNLQQYQSQQHADVDIPAGPAVRIIQNPSTVSVETIDGVDTIKTKGQEFARSSEASPFHGTDSIFATARNQNGTPAMAIGDATLLEYQGMQMTAKSLAALGVISRSPDGSYSDKPTAAAGHEAGEEQQDEDTVSEDHVEIHPDNMTEIHEAMAGVSESAVHGLLAIGIGVATGKLEGAALEQRWTQATGQHGEDSKLARMQTIFQHQADRAAQKVGIGAQDLDAFYAWGREGHRDQLADAVTKLVHQADASGFRALAQRYLTTNAPSVEALKAAGLEVRKGADGQPLVFSKAGGWITLKAAARAGLL